MSEHTILLVQTTSKLDSRTWSDYESAADACEAVCKMFEEHLRSAYPDRPTIKYDIKHLFDFIDRLADLSCLVLDDSSCQYVPHNKDWMKDNILIMMRNQAERPEPAV